MKTIVALVCLLGIFPGQAQTRSDAQSVPASQTSSETVPEPLPADAPAVDELADRVDALERKAIG